MASSAGGEDLGKLVLRLAVGVLVLFHGVAKILSGPAMIVGLVTKAGLPGSLGYLVYVGEVLAPLMLILGVWTRLAALVMVINMLTAVWLVHLGDVFTLNAKTGGWTLELQGMYLFGALTIVLIGAGRFSFGGAHGRWN